MLHARWASAAAAAAGGHIYGAFSGARRLSWTLSRSCAQFVLHCTHQQLLTAALHPLVVYPSVIDVYALPAGHYFCADPYTVKITEPPKFAAGRKTLYCKVSVES
jgi:hypothetical protein